METTANKLFRRKSRDRSRRKKIAWRTLSPKSTDKERTPKASTPGESRWFFFCCLSVVTIKMQAKFFSSAWCRPAHCIPSEPMAWSVMDYDSDAVRLIASHWKPWLDLSWITTCRVGPFVLDLLYRFFFLMQWWQLSCHAFKKKSETNIKQTSLNGWSYANAFWTRA